MAINALAIATRSHKDRTGVNPHYQKDAIDNKKHLLQPCDGEANFVTGNGIKDTITNGREIKSLLALISKRIIVENLEARNSVGIICDLNSCVAKKK